MDLLQNSCPYPQIGIILLNFTQNPKPEWK